MIRGHYATPALWFLRPFLFSMMSLSTPGSSQETKPLWSRTSCVRRPGGPPGPSQHMGSHAAHWLTEILLETVDRKTTPLYFHWDFQSQTSGPGHDKCLFWNKKGEKKELYWSYFHLNRPVNMELTGLERKKTEIRESMCGSAPPLNQQLSALYVLTVINLVWQIQPRSGWRAGVLS